MAQLRRPSVRGRIARGESTSTTPKVGKLPPPEPVSDPEKPRSVVDYALQRAADITRFHKGGMLSSDFCDADPYLLKAARFHGEPTERPCPACARGTGNPTLKELHYIYGDQLGPYAGRIRQAGQLAALSHQFGEFRVYQVEVCLDCGWNYLLRAYSLGDGTPRRAVPSIRAEDLLD